MEDLQNKSIFDSLSKQELDQLIIKLHDVIERKLDVNSIKSCYENDKHVNILIRYKMKSDIKTTSEGQKLNKDQDQSSVEGNLNNSEKDFTFQNSKNNRNEDSDFSEITFKNRMNEEKNNYNNTSNEVNKICSINNSFDDFNKNNLEKQKYDKLSNLSNRSFEKISNNQLEFSDNSLNKKNPIPNNDIEKDLYYKAGKSLTFSSDFDCKPQENFTFYNNRPNMNQSEENETTNYFNELKEPEIETYKSNTANDKVNQLIKNQHNKQSINLNDISTPITTDQQIIPDKLFFQNSNNLTNNNFFTININSGDKDKEPIYYDVQGADKSINNKGMKNIIKGFDFEIPISSTNSDSSEKEKEILKLKMLSIFLLKKIEKKILQIRCFNKNISTLNKQELLKLDSSQTKLEYFKKQVHELDKIIKDLESNFETKQNPYISNNIKKYNNINNNEQNIQNLFQNNKNNDNNRNACNDKYLLSNNKDFKPNRDNNGKILVKDYNDCFNEKNFIQNDFFYRRVNSNISCIKQVNYNNKNNHDYDHINSLKNEKIPKKILKEHIFLNSWEEIPSYSIKDKAKEIMINQNPSDLKNNGIYSINENHKFYIKDAGCRINLQTLKVNNSIRNSNLTCHRNDKDNILKNNISDKIYTQIISNYLNEKLDEEKDESFKKTFCKRIDILNHNDSNENYFSNNDQEEGEEKINFDLRDKILKTGFNFLKNIDQSSYVDIKNNLNSEKDFSFLNKKQIYHRDKSLSNNEYVLKGFSPKSKSLLISDFPNKIQGQAQGIKSLENFKIKNMENSNLISDNLGFINNGINNENTKKDNRGDIFLNNINSINDSFNRNPIYSSENFNKIDSKEKLNINLNRAKLRDSQEFKNYSNSINSDSNDFLKLSCKGNCFENDNKVLFDEPRYLLNNNTNNRIKMEQNRNNYDNFDIQKVQSLGMNNDRFNNIKTNIGANRFMFNENTFNKKIEKTEEAQYISYQNQNILVNEDHEIRNNQDSIDKNINNINISHKNSSVIHNNSDIINKNANNISDANICKDNSSNHVNFVYVVKKMISIDECIIKEGEDFEISQQDDSKKEMMYICKFKNCFMNFARENLFVVHYRDTHLNNKNFSCTHCQKSYKNKATLRMHEKRAHAINSIYKCGYEGNFSLNIYYFISKGCGKSYATEKNYIKHLEVIHKQFVNNIKSDKLVIPDFKPNITLNNEEEEEGNTSLDNFNKKYLEKQLPD